MGIIRVIMRFMLLAFMLFFNLGCVHEYNQNQKTNLSEDEYFIIKQERLDAYKVSINPLDTMSSRNLKATIFIHGAASSMKNLFQFFSPRKGELFIFVNAPYPPPYAYKHGSIGFEAWPRISIGIGERSNLPIDIIEKALELQGKHLWKIIDEVRERYRIKPKIDIVGFSQGGIVAYHMASVRIKEVRGLSLAFTPLKGLIFNATLQSEKRSLRVLLLHNEDDPLVTISNSYYSQDLFIKEGVDVSTVFKKRGGHKLTSEGIDVIRKFIRSNQM